MKFLLVLALMFFSFIALGEEYLVKVNDEAVLKGLNYEKVTEGVYLIKSDNKNMERNLTLTQGILHVEENQMYSISYKRAQATDLWGLYSEAGIKAKEAWAITKGSKDVVIAVIDTGVDYNHPDLKDNMWVNVNEIPGNGIDDDGNGFVDDIHGYDFAYGDADPMDGQGHGTHCAGTIGAVHNDFGVEGVMANVRIMALKFLSDYGSGSTANAIKSIDYAIQNGATIMSNSWGGGGFSQLLKEAIERANDAGILFVAASGNSNRDTDAKPHYPSSYKVDNVLAVASHTVNDVLSSFSNYGATSVDVSAPGSNILSTWPNNKYKAISGTSMATPHVSGIAGLMLSKNPKMTPKRVIKKIMNNVEKGSQYKDKVKSCGRVNAEKSL